MNILFEDRHIVVCIKPVGLLSQADENGGESMITALESQCGTSIFPLHRLDREVGGIMVYAKTKQAAAILSQAIAAQQLQKEYIAWVHGCPSPSQGELRDLLFKDSRKNKSFVVERMRKGVKEARLAYRVISTREMEGQPRSAVQILLHTGRTHQIRVQFSSRKMPLIGDRRYGARDEDAPIGLWSFRLRFAHPITHVPLCFAAMPDFAPLRDGLPATADELPLLS